MMNKDAKFSMLVKLKGVTFEVLQDAMVAVRNPTGIDGHNRFFNYGDMGGILAGATVEVVDMIGDKFLVVYTPFAGIHGWHLPRGSAFFADLKHFRRLKPNENPVDVREAGAIRHANQETLPEKQKRDREKERNKERSTDIYGNPDYDKKPDS